MAWTQVDADRIRKAIAQGALKVVHDGKEVTYRSLADMKATLSMIENELAGATGQTRVRQFRFTSGKGL